MIVEQQIIASSENCIMSFFNRLFSPHMAFAVLVHCIDIGFPKSYRCICYTNILYLLKFFFSSPAARQISLNPPKKTTTGDHNEDGLCVLIFEPLIGSDYSVSCFQPFIDDFRKKFILLFLFIS